MRPGACAPCPTSEKFLPHFLSTPAQATRIAIAVHVQAEGLARDPLAPTRTVGESPRSLSSHLVVLSDPVLYLSSLRATITSPRRPAGRSTGYSQTARILQESTSHAKTDCHVAGHLVTARWELQKGLFLRKRESSLRVGDGMSCRGVSRLESSVNGLGPRMKAFSSSSAESSCLEGDAVPSERYDGIKLDSKGKCLLWPCRSIRAV